MRSLVLSQVDLHLQKWKHHLWRLLENVKTTFCCKLWPTWTCTSWNIRQWHKSGVDYLQWNKKLKQNVNRKFQDMEIWLDLLLCCKNGGRSIEGRIARPAFESVWDVDVIGFTPDSSASGFNGFQMSGRHRLCVIDGFLHFYAMGSSDRITFQMREIRKFGCDKRKFRFVNLS